MQPIVRAVARFLHKAEILDRGMTVRGFLDGQVVTFALKLATFGSTTKKWTEARARAPHGVFFRIRPNNAWVEAEIEKGLGVDHILRDRMFDDTFIVEAAPERIVRELLDAQVRKAILDLNPDDEVTSFWRLNGVLTTIDGDFVLEVPDWIEKMKSAKLLLRTVVRLANTGKTIVQRDHSQPSGYRGEAIVGGAPSEDEKEVRELRAKVADRDRRRHESNPIACLIVLVAFIVGFALLVALIKSLQESASPRKGVHGWFSPDPELWLHGAA